MCYEVIAVAEVEEDETVTLRAYDRLVPESEADAIGIKLETEES